MKTVIVERKLPESLKECEQLMTVSRCLTCACGASWVNCAMRSMLVNIGIEDGNVVKVRDSNGEEFLQEVVN